MRKAAYAGSAENRDPVIAEIGSYKTGMLPEFARNLRSRPEFELEAFPFQLFRLGQLFIEDFPRRGARRDKQHELLGVLLQPIDFVQQKFVNGISDELRVEGVWDDTLALTGGQPRAILPRGQDIDSSLRLS